MICLLYAVLIYGRLPYDGYLYGCLLNVKDTLDKTGINLVINIQICVRLSDTYLDCIRGIQRSHS